MYNKSQFFSEKHLRYIQRTLKVSRSEIITTIWHSHISAQRIAAYLKQQKQRFETGVAGTGSRDRAKYTFFGVRPTATPSLRRKQAE